MGREFFSDMKEVLRKCRVNRIYWKQIGQGKENIWTWTLCLCVCLCVCLMDKIHPSPTLGLVLLYFILFLSPLFPFPFSLITPASTFSTLLSNSLCLTIRPNAPSYSIILYEQRFSHLSFILSPVVCFLHLRTIFIYLYIVFGEDIAENVDVM